MRAVLLLACVLSAAPAAADESGRQGRGDVDLSLRAKAPPARELLAGNEEPEPPGLWLGPVFVDGPFAHHLRRLSAPLRQGLSRHVGPQPITFEQIAYERSFGLGLYLRLP